MATEVNEGCDFMRISNNLDPRLVLGVLDPLRQNLIAVLVEAHDLLPDGRGSPGGSFMRVVEDHGSGITSPVVELALRQDTNQGRFARVYVSDNSNSDVRQGKILRFLLLLLFSFHYLTL